MARRKENHQKNHHYFISYFENVISPGVIADNLYHLVHRENFPHLFQEDLKFIFNFLGQKNNLETRRSGECYFSKIKTPKMTKKCLQSVIHT